MSRWSLSVALFVLVAQSITSAAEPMQRMIMVTAEGGHRVVPDVVHVNLSINSQHVELIEAKKDNDIKTRAILALAKPLKIADADVELSNVKVGPEFERDDNGRMRQTSYSVERSVKFSIRNFNNLEPLLSKALGAGCDNIRAVSFDVSDQRPHQVVARRLAVERAREKASHLAELNGLKLGKAIRIAEDVERTGSDHSGGFGGGGFGAIIPDANDRTREKLVETPSAPRPHLISQQAKLRLVSLNQKVDAEKDNAAKPKAAEDKDDSLPVAPGVVWISATVTITFELVE